MNLKLKGIVQILIPDTPLTYKKTDLKWLRFVQNHDWETHCLKLSSLFSRK